MAIERVTPGQVEAIIKEKGKEAEVNSEEITAIVDGVNSLIEKAIKTKNEGVLRSAEVMVETELRNLERKRLKETLIPQIRSLLAEGAALYKKVIPNGSFFKWDETTPAARERSLKTISQALGARNGMMVRKEMGEEVWTQEETILVRLRALLKSFTYFIEDFDLDSKSDGIIGTSCVTLEIKTLRAGELVPCKKETILMVYPTGRVQLKDRPGQTIIHNIFPNPEAAKKRHPGWNIDMSSSS